jgi:hypothetical protein
MIELNGDYPTAFGLSELIIEIDDALAKLEEIQYPYL